MSTKTLRKRIALTSVVALVSGLVSVAPANAAVNAGLLAYVNSSSTVNVASAGAVSLATGQSGVSYVKNTTVASAAVSSITLPASSVVAFKLTAGNAGTWDTGTAARVKVNGALKASTLACTISTVTCTLANFTAPSTAGTYAIDLIVSGASTSYAAADVETVSLTLVVTAGPLWSQGGTTAYMVNTAATLPTSTTDAQPIAVSKALNQYAGTILVSLKNTDGAVYTGQTVEAVVSGVGFVGGSSATYDATPATFATNIGTADGSAVTTRSVSVTDTTGYVAFGIWGDGQAGTGTVTIKVTDQITSAVTTIATKTVTFFGDVTKLEVAKSNFTIGKAGTETGKAATARTLSGEVTNAGALNASTTTPAFVIKASDTAGNIANTAANPTVVSSDYSVIGSGTCVKDDGSSTTYSSGSGFGYYNCSFTAAQGAASGSKATLTFRIVDPADSTKFITTTAAVTVGGSIDKEVITFDKASYAPGEALNVTITATDSKGNPVADGSASPAITFSKTVGGTAPAASTYVGGKKSSTSAGVASVFAPAVAGSFSALATSGNAAGSAISTSATVAGANDAQIASLINKINALSKLIAKIQKKLGIK